MKTAIMAMTARRHKAIFNHLFPGDGLEAAAILLCNQGTGKLYHRLIVADILSLPHHHSLRKRGFVSWPFGDCLSPARISDIDRRRQSIVTIHSHPNGHDRFSRVDDRNDRELFASVGNWFDDGRLNGSAIMLPDGAIKARIVDVRGKFSGMSTVSVVGDDIYIWKQLRQKKTGRLSWQVIADLWSRNVGLVAEDESGGCRLLRHWQHHHRVACA